MDGSDLKLSIIMTIKNKMLNFKLYLVEQFEQKLFESIEEKTRLIKHLSHVEDLGHEFGHEGTEHAIGALSAAAQHIEHGKHDSSFTSKIDGGISIVAGKHPINGKQCVAYKSALDKVGTDKEHSAKVCYSHADIDKHYSDKSHVAVPLHHALDNAHKVLPKDGLHQGDVLFTSKTKKEEGDKISFEPNTIKYSAKKSSAEGKKISKARFGAAWHTSYQMIGGKLQSSPINHDTLKNHDDSYNLSTSNDTGRAHFSEADKAAVNGHIESARKIHKDGGQDMHSAVHNIGNHVSTYINQTVRDDKKPSTEGLKSHIASKGKKEFDSLKTEKAKNKKIDDTQNTIGHVDNNSAHFDNYFKMHHHLQQAKDIIVKTLDNADHPLEHTINGKKSHPEGYVFNHKGLPVKLVQRKVFSKANFGKVRD